MPLEGQQLGRYRLLSLIGSGGMGKVYLAEDTLIDRQVAIKVIRAETSSHPDSTPVQQAMRLFQREAKAIAKLNHPHILPLFDFGEEHIDGTTLTYMVMPFCQDGSLLNWLQQRDSTDLLSLHEIVYLLDQAADALQYAHDQQIIHQDVKPHNFLIRRGRNSTLSDLLLTDFGIAKVTALSADKSYSIRGTPLYMAPEQWEGRPVPATDQYALATMVYQLLTGRPLFQGGRVSVMYQHMKVQPQPPSTLNPRVTPEIDAVLLRALAKSPADRFPSVSSFAQAFKQAAIGTGLPIAPTLPIARAKVTENGAADVDSTDHANAPTAITPDDAIDAYSTINQVDDVDAHSTVPAMAHELVTTDEAIDAYSTVSTIAEGLANQDDAVDAHTPSPPVVQEPGTADVAGILASAAPRAGARVAPTIHAFGGRSVYSRGGACPRPASRTIVPVGLALLFILISTSLLYYFADRNPAITAQARATATAQANATNGAEANATATAQTREIAAAATATASALVSNATSTAANATATASTIAANATATASVIAANPDPYPPGNGTLTLYDPLSDNSRGYDWENYLNDVSECTFTGGTFHVIEKKASFFANCFATKTNFSNFVYEVQMTIMTGNCGGIMFRADQANNKFYYFRVCQDGSFALYLYVDNKLVDAQLLTKGSDPAIHTGLNQQNTIAVVANAIGMDLYVNRKLILNGSVKESTYSHGQIAVAADAEPMATEVVFNNARVWTL